MLAICNWIQKRQWCQVTTQCYSKEYKLTVNASDLGVGAVLIQEGKDDIDLPNCHFFLKSLTTIRTNNPQLIKTAFWCTFHLFVVFTDHDTVTFINNMQTKSQINEMWINVARISAWMQDNNVLLTSLQTWTNPAI